MCDACEWSGLLHHCAKCGGFDWVVDIYRPEVEVLARLCSDCRPLWSDLLANSL